MAGTPQPTFIAVSRAFAARLATAALAALLLYLLLVLALHARVGGVTLDGWWIAAAFFGGTAVLWVGLRRTAWLGTGGLINLALAAAGLLAAMLLADLGISAYLGLTTPDTDIETLARTDRHALVEEWYPRTYYPSGANFVIQKPDFTITGRHYGGYYIPGMLRSRTLADSVLDLRELTIHIDGRGFRERSPLDACPVLALGDSFTFGWGVTDGATWPDLLETALGRCVYNLGVNGASPAQEEMLLDDLFSRDTALAPRRVLWALYEGNDLEDSYADELPAAVVRSPAERAISGTLLEAAQQMWINLRTESLLYRLRAGQFRLRSPATRRGLDLHETVDGVKLATPLFHSTRLGYLMVDPTLLWRAAVPESYVRHHRHRRQLDRAFDRMRRLAAARGFAVTVVIIPSAPRLYAPDFDFAPTPSRVPYFIEYLTGLSRTHGFEVVNLLDRLAPIARGELLHFRDDDHLNPRGHEATARILADHLRELDAARQP